MLSLLHYAFLPNPADSLKSSIELLARLRVCSLERVNIPPDAKGLDNKELVVYRSLSCIAYIIGVVTLGLEHTQGRCMGQLTGVIQFVVRDVQSFQISIGIHLAAQTHQTYKSNRIVYL